MSVYPTSEDAITIINAAAVEVGLTPVTDPFSSSDDAFVQMKYLLNTAGREISRMYDWQVLLKDGTISVSSADTGLYDLPVDYLSMLNDTLWDTTNDRRVVGPLKPNKWSELVALDTTSLDCLYFRVKDGQFSLYPNNPVGSDKELIYSYKSAYWVVASDGDTFKKSVVTGTDKPLFDSLLMSRYLKLKWLQAKNFDTADAQADFQEQFMIITGADTPADIINLSSPGSYPYIDPYNNVRDTGYGS